MCTLVVLSRPGHRWPILLAANRDEMESRPWISPGRHWPEYPHIVAGRDQLASGSWLAFNDHGVVAAVLNRRNSLGAAEGYRSRGELPLIAASGVSADEGVERLLSLSANHYRPFNMVVCDSRGGYWLRNCGEVLESFALPTGLSILTAYDLNDTSSPRINNYLPRFLGADSPAPDRAEWSDWIEIIGDRKGAVEGGMESESGPASAMNVVTDIGFGTICSSLIALPAKPSTKHRPQWLFAAGRPDAVPFRPVDRSVSGP